MNAEFEKKLKIQGLNFLLIFFCSAESHFSQKIFNSVGTLVSNLPAAYGTAATDFRKQT